ncbi:uncharacterized protein F4822DRAFT_429731 [Hypoxylon trugodes]|uniref:uncharacterized protein n=1 Tax=Hypoxylon trugodes TaxID=326681 RepID=UPI00218CAA1E|nr:uncharacterized protein F4822DRAFT_429731 [Hypoxylon trugodes]KAI1389118.1 hypothetical protein F4822DRAFT_429731 [Hypoxylon trugodes]
MSAEATAAMASAPEAEMVEIKVANHPSTNDALGNKPTGLHSPPDSNSAMKLDGSDDSELSDLDDHSIIDMNVDMDFDSSHPLPSNPSIHDEETKEGGKEKEEPEPEEEEDIGDVFPDHWSGTVPVFKPDMHQFKDFKKFMTKVDCYGMKSGIIKIIPPQEWKDERRPLDDMIKQIRVKEPIKQEIMGSNGTYRQVNILHQRSYNIPQWRQLCDQSEHQPPARRGERRAQAQAKPKPAAPSTSTSGEPRKRGRPPRARGKRVAAKDNNDTEDDRPMTPVSPKPNEDIIESVEKDFGADLDDDDDVPVVGRMGGSRQAKPKTQSTSARRKYARREASAKIDEKAFKDFDYQMDISDYTPERCEELERIYWKTLTYAPPLYGADLPGTLFDEDCTSWNLNKLPNLLDVLGTKVPGVNTAYLYLGMWKATFAWHLEDVDLYSINYLHFGAPKQWYSISQGDARRFEAAMKSIWPTDAKACDQFLRHKAFLISPNHLLQNFNIKVNKCVSYPGEFVVTYPYGYHSGYNLGYNCAEAVNFALDSWLPMGRIAKRCECAQAQDSVWVDVYEIERKLRGEETEYEETEDEDEEDEEDDEDMDTVATPQSSHAVRIKQPGRKRKRAPTEKGERKVKKIRLRAKNHIEPPCCLCPHDIPGQELLPTADGRKAHRLCALYGPETWIETVEEKETVANTEGIGKARGDTKCLYCRSKRGACMQCSQKKCNRSYHATCAMAAGVLVEEADVPIFGEDGTEYKEHTFEFSCRFHRTKRDRKMDVHALGECSKTHQAAAALKKGDMCQLQYYRGDIFAGVVVENRADEQMLLVDVIPHGERVEVEWKWLLLPDPADFHLQKASANAIPMPTSRKAKELINATKRVAEEPPRPDAPFVEGFTWAEFNTYDCTNKLQAKVDFSKENQLWHYLGRYSTDARPQYTEDPKNPKHNVKSNFLDTIPKPALPPVQPRKLYGSTFSMHTTGFTGVKPDKPYQYKPKDPVAPSYARSPFTPQQFVPKPASFTPHQFVPKPTLYPSQPASAPKSQPPLVPAPRQNIQFAPPQAIPKLPPTYQHNGHFSQQVFAKPPITPQHTSFHHVTPPQQAFQPIAGYSPQQPPTRLPAYTGQQIGQHSYPRMVPKPASPPQPSVQPQPTPHQPVSTPVSTPQGGKQNPPLLPHSHTKSASIPRTAPTQNGHKRNRSSLNLQNGQPSPFGSDHRFKTPPFSYGSNQINSAAKSPFSHGFSQPPGLGPSPSPQNGQLFQAQARARSGSLASNRSYDTPMTSSAIRPPSSASAQGPSGGETQFAQFAQAAQTTQTAQQQVNVTDRSPVNIVQKYPFFQVHHNRDSTKYRTPYAHWGGFTNGYEGSLRAHLMRSPEALFDIRNRSMGFGAGSSSQHIPRNPFSNPASNKATPVLTSHLGSISSSRQAATSPSVASPSPFSAGAPSTPPVNQHVMSRAASIPDVHQEPAAQLHPAIRAQYAAILQTRNTDNFQPNANEQATTPSQPSAFATLASLPNHLDPTTRPTQSPGLEFIQYRDNGSRSASVNDDKNSPPMARAGPTKVPFVPSKQTHIPAPRPWEAIRKPQNPVQSALQIPIQDAPPNGANEAAGNPTTIPYAPGSYMSNEYDDSRHMASPGPQPSNSQQLQPDQSQPAPVQFVQPITVRQSSTQAGEPSTGTTTTTATDGGTSGGLGSVQLAVATKSLTTTYARSPAVGTDDLPEVPDESMELIESIIRDARRISDTYWDTTNGGK